MLLLTKRGESEVTQFLTIVLASESLIGPAPLVTPRSATSKVNETPSAISLICSVLLRAKIPRPDIDWRVQVRLNDRQQPGAQ
jgi:hypothetical protein